MCGPSYSWRGWECPSKTIHCHPERSREWSGLGKSRRRWEGRGVSDREVSESKPAATWEVSNRGTPRLRLGRQTGLHEFAQRTLCHRSFQELAPAQIVSTRNVLARLADS